MLLINKNCGRNHSDFIQIGVDKKKKEILSILDNMKKKEKIIERNIRKVFGIKKVSISLVFIFDLKTQTDNNYKTIAYCEKYGINYYMFSYEEGCLYKHNFDKNKDEKISSYSPSKKKLSDY